MLRRLLTLLAVASACAASATSHAAAGPPPEPGSITVRAVGDRDPLTGDPGPLAGARLVAYADAALTVAVGECTTGAAGTCAITGVPPGTYHVAPAADAAVGVHAPVGGIATSADPAATVPYVDEVVVGESAPTTRAFAFRRANPPFPGSCGVRVTLVYDLSQSISPAEAATMKAASYDFVDALAGTPSAVAIASFASAAPAAGNSNLTPTPVATPAGATAVREAVAALSLPSGDDRYTNWDAAFRSVAGQSDVVVLFTDGNPTVHGVPAVFPPVVTAFAQVEGGILSANAVKAAGARVLAVGVGNVGEIAPANLTLVSGPVEGEDYAITTFADVETVFRALAEDLCPAPEPPVVVSPAPAPVPAPPRFTG